MSEEMSAHLTVRRHVEEGVTEREVIVHENDRVDSPRPWLVGELSKLAMDPKVVSFSVEWKARGHE